MTRGIVVLVGALLASGCLFKGKPKPPPVAETVETTRLRADSIWVAATGHLREGRWAKAATALDRALLIMQYDDPRRPRGHFMMGEALMGQGNPLQAVREFRRVADENASDPLAPDALLRAGDAYAALWTKPQLDPSYGESAVTTYREVMDRFPDTPAAFRATRQIQELQEMFAAKDFETAMFYLRLKAYDSAILSFRSVIANYPRSKVTADALVKLVQAYRVVDYAEDLKETCAYVQRFFPATMPRLVRECPAEPAAAK
jgi:outer membrane protein assembly factor BamD